jgi:hypothetical protein
MEKLEELRNMRNQARQYFSQKNKNRYQLRFVGFYIKTGHKSFEVVKKEVAEYFEFLEFTLKNTRSPSPKGVLDGYEVYVSAVCENYDYSKFAGVSCEIVHDDERKII